MTTIAFDGKVLAADRCMWNGGTRNVTRKVFRIRREGREFLVGIAGNASLGMAVLAWMRGGDKPDTLHWPAEASADRDVALVVNEKGRAFRLCARSLVYVTVRQKFTAFGAGAEFAMGAMAAGASAVEAVRLAQRWTDYAGHGVDWLEVRR